MSFKNFIFSRTFLKNLLIAAGVIIVIILIVLAVLRSYTSHGEGYAVPNLTGKTEEEFSEILRVIDLKYKIIDSVYVSEENPGSVVDQVPKPGLRVKKNRTIFLTLNASSPEQVIMPKLRDISFRQAQGLIENLGMKVGNIRFSPSEYNDLVLSALSGYHEIQPGDLLPKGTVIDLVVGSGSGLEKTSVPYLIGMPISDARTAILDGLLNPGVIIYDESVILYEDSINARIWKQRPDPREVSSTEMGSSIDIWVTIDSLKINETVEN